MSLLVDLWTNSLDPGYAAAAARHADADAAASGARRRVPSVALALGVAATVLVVVMGAEQAHGRAPAAALSRAELASEVQRQSQAVTSLTRQVDDLRAATARLRDASLAATGSGSVLRGQLSRQELAAGFVAVQGPGVSVTLDDAASTTDGQRNRVLDRDLQGVVNALWAAGAEAVAINGQRLTGQSSIRQAGEAILVDFQPLHAPYVVSAIGDPVAVESMFATSPAANRMRSYAQLYGLRFHYSRVQTLTLPAAAEEPMQAAAPAATPRRSGP